MRGIVTAMNRLLVASCVLSSFAGACALGGGAAGSPVGTYTLDKDAMKAAATDVPAAQVEAFLKGIGDGTIELKADGTAALFAKVDFNGRWIEDRTTGTWRLDGSTLSVTAKSKDGTEHAQVGDYGDGVFTVREGAGE